ncbi:hypothetical protein R3P38DRAFT_3212294 [Favolaschia claudopus]|uniref:Uncharacterized protein n=1 Tax=Favolaschia claudopus TaxID=2862362 RepID=A0AAW0ADM4_9AGAR
MAPTTRSTADAPNATNARTTRSRAKLDPTHNTLPSLPPRKKPLKKTSKITTHDAGSSTRDDTSKKPGEQQDSGPSVYVLVPSRSNAATDAPANTNIPGAGDDAINLAGAENGDTADLPNADRDRNTPVPAEDHMDIDEVEVEAPKTRSTPRSLSKKTSPAPTQKQEDTFNDYTGLVYDEFDNNDPDAYLGWPEQFGRPPDDKVHSSPSPSNPPSPHASPSPSPQRSPRTLRKRDARTPLEDGLDSDLPDSDNDYAQTKAAADLKRKNCLRQGFSAEPSTSDEDREDSSEEEASGKRGKKAGKKAGKKGKVAPAARENGKDKAVAKSKGKAAAHSSAKASAAQLRRGAVPDIDDSDSDEPDVDEDSDEDGDDESEVQRKPRTTRYKAGPLPASAIEELEVLRGKVMKDVDEIAAKYGKDPSMVFRALGIVVDSGIAGRSTSVWNMWQQYWAENGPKGEKATQAGLLERLGADFPKDQINNKEAVFKRFPGLREWHENTMKTAIAQLAEKGKLKGKIRQAIKPITTIARHTHNAFKVTVFGFVIDPLHHNSFMFGSGDAYKELRRVRQSSLVQDCAEYEHLIGVIEMKERGLITGGLPAKSLARREAEGSRDAARRQFSSILAAQLYQRYQDAEVDVGDLENFKMIWSPRLIDVALQLQCKIVNFPAALVDAKMIIGTQGFKLKDIKASTFEKFLPDLIKASKPQTGDDDEDLATTVMAIEPWTEEEKETPFEDQGNIAVVVNCDNRGLVWVKNSDKFHKQIKDRLDKAEKDARKAEKKQKGKSKAAPPPSPSTARRSRSHSPDRRRDYAPALRAVSPPHDEYGGSRGRSHRRRDSRSRSPRRHSPRGYRNHSRSRSPSRAYRNHSRSRSPSRAYRNHSRSRSPSRAYPTYSRRSASPRNYRSPSRRHDYQSSRRRSRSRGSAAEDQPQPLDFQRPARGNQASSRLDVIEDPRGKRKASTEADPEKTAKRLRKGPVEGDQELLERHEPVACRFRFKNEDGETVESPHFYARGLIATPQPTTADNVTYMLMLGQWKKIPPGFTVSLVDMQAVDNYRRLVDLYAL